MKRILSNTPLVIVALTMFIFILCQFGGTKSGQSGGLCAENLTNPSENSYPANSWISFGIPWNFLTITSQGCFTERVSRAEWSLGNLFINVLFFTALGTVVYGFVQIMRRFSRR